VQLVGGDRGQRYVAWPAGHAPIGEDDGQLFAGHRGVGVALDGDLAGLRTPDTRVVDADHIAVGRDGPEHQAGRPGVLPVVTKERAQLPRLPEAGRVGGGVGHSGGEGEGGEYAEHARDRTHQSRPNRYGGTAASGLKSETGADHHRHGQSCSGCGHRHGGSALGSVPPAGGERCRRGGGRSGQH
jgi:hypothetical protein